MRRNDSSGLLERVYDDGEGHGRKEAQKIPAMAIIVFLLPFSLRLLRLFAAIPTIFLFGKLPPQDNVCFHATTVIILMSAHGAVEGQTREMEELRWV